MMRVNEMRAFTGGALMALTITTTNAAEQDTKNADYLSLLQN
jgi:hypothetical protein